MLGVAPRVMLFVFGDRLVRETGTNQECNFSMIFRFRDLRTGRGLPAFVFRATVKRVLSHHSVQSQSPLHMKFV